MCAEISNRYLEEIECLREKILQMNGDYSSTMASHKDDKNLSFSQWCLSDKLLNDIEQRQLFISDLEKEFIRVNSLVTEANDISQEMQRQIVYNVVLEISASYLKPNERVCSQFLF